MDAWMNKILEEELQGSKMQIESRKMILRYLRACCIEFIIKVISKADQNLKSDHSVSGIRRIMADTVDNAMEDMSLEKYHTKNKVHATKRKRSEPETNTAQSKSKRPVRLTKAQERKLIAEQEALFKKAAKKLL